MSKDAAARTAKTAKKTKETPKAKTWVDEIRALKQGAQPEAQKAKQAK